VQVANAARSALVAIDLAEARMPGVRSSIDGPFGYFALLEVSSEIGPALARLGHGHRIGEVSWKPFPTGRAAHPGIIAVQRLMREHGLREDSFDRLEFHAPPLIHRLVGRPARQGMETGYARLCLPWLAAVTLVRGTISLSDFAPESLADEGVLKLAERITVVPDGNPDPAAFVPARASAWTVDGDEIVAQITAQFGSPAWPLSRDEHLAKTRDCLRFAGLEECHAPLAEAVERIEHATDAAAAIRATGIMG
jgi:2-methylcitrate dehydratase PrpD